MTLFDRIAQIQTSLKLNSTQIAEKLGISEELFKAELKNPHPEFIQKLAETFKISMDYLETGNGPIFSKQFLPIEEILAFRDNRNWKQFHTPKDLAISLSLEASELLECFQWSGEDLQVKNKQSDMEEELADILIYSVLFADAIGADITSIIKNKLTKNGEKYQVEKSYGSAKKYTEF